MKNFFLTIVVLLFAQIAFCQDVASRPVNNYARVDKIALQLPADQVKTTQDIADYVNTHFVGGVDRARAIFIWVASNIQYDVANMFNVNFYESRQDKIDRVLSTHKGICENYAAIFCDVANKCGIKSFVVEGYDKQNGFTDYLPHAWCAGLVNNTWYLFDPTWGAGYVSNHQFVKKINNDLFMVPPGQLIKSHMPFDPMWELLYYPVTNQDFAAGKTGEDNSKPYFSYPDSIAVYEKENEQQQMVSEVRRLQANGVNGSLVFDRLQHLKNTIDVNSRNRNVSEYNTAAADYNDAVNLYNEFINYYNVQFKPTKPDTEIQHMTDTTQASLSAARVHLAAISEADAPTLALINSLQTSITELQKHVDEQKDFVAKYIGKSKMGRKLMFNKYTWMGIPLNK